MKVTINIDENLWKEIMSFVSSKYSKPTKSREKIINEILKVGLEVIKNDNLEDVINVLESSEVSDEFLNFMSKISSSIRERSACRA